MSTRTTIKLTGLAAAMLVFLAVAPAAGAKPVGPVGPFPPGAHSVGVTVQGESWMAGPSFTKGNTIAIAGTGTVNRPLPPDRADKLGVTTTNLVPPPDRVDKLGTAAGPQPVQVATISTSASTSFDWTDALIGAGAGIVLALLAAGGVAATRNRRGGVALS
jgi:hypothetical protein